MFSLFIYKRFSVKRLFVVGCLSTLSFSANSQFLDDNFEKYYLMRNYDLIARKSQELGWSAYYDERGTIGNEVVFDKVTLIYSKGFKTYDIDYTYKSYEIGILESGEIMAFASVYKMTFGMQYGLLYPIERYIWAFDNLDMRYRLNTTTHKRDDILVCDRVSTDLDYWTNLNVMDMYGSWLELVSDKMDCRNKALYHTRKWGTSRLSFNYNNDLRNSFVPESMRPSDWYKKIYDLENQGFAHDGGNYTLAYQMKEDELAKLIGLESDLYSRIPLEVDANNQFWISPKIDGTIEYKMMFDTGASLTTVSNKYKETFLELGIIRRTRRFVSMETADGSIIQTEIFYCNFELGGKIYPDIEVVFTDGTSLFGMNITSQLNGWRIQGSDLIYKKL